MGISAIDSKSALDKSATNSLTDGDKNFSDECDRTAKSMYSISNQGVIKSNKTLLHTD
ncbi:MAG: hypothetical protein V7K38_08360 [Nostoc sp.]|uniref:hypothetical protein n=1 Tax=Nostoc sp. TaxID=1180 RepID=UPI002FFB9303